MSSTGLVLAKTDEKGPGAGMGEAPGHVRNLPSLVIPITVASPPGGRRDKPIGVARGVDIKPDQLPPIVYAVDGRRAHPVRVIDRLEVPVPINEAVGHTGQVHICSYNLALIVQAERLGKGGLREIDRPERPGRQQKGVVGSFVVDIETGDGLAIVDAGRLGADRSGNGQHQKHAAFGVVEVGMIVVVGVRIIAGCLVQIVYTEQLVESGARKINRLEGALNVQEAMIGPTLVDVEAGRIGAVVDAHNLGLSRTGEVLGGKSGGQAQLEPLEIRRVVVTRDPAIIVNAQQLREVIARDGRLLEGIIRRLSQCWQHHGAEYRQPQAKANPALLPPCVVYLNGLYIHDMCE